MGSREPASRACSPIEKGPRASSSGTWRVVQRPPSTNRFSPAASPSSAMLPNQASITGPKIRPMKPVPFAWTRNSTTRIATVIGSTAGPRCGASTFSPSTALSTEIAGVIAPSP